MAKHSWLRHPSDELLNVMLPAFYEAVSVGHDLTAVYFAGYFVERYIQDSYMRRRWKLGINCDTMVKRSLRGCEKSKWLITRSTNALLYRTVVTLHLPLYHQRMADWADMNSKAPWQAVWDKLTEMDCHLLKDVDCYRKLNQALRFQVELDVDVADKIHSYNPSVDASDFMRITDTYTNRKVLVHYSTVLSVVNAMTAMFMETS